MFALLALQALASPLGTATAIPGTTWVHVELANGLVMALDFAEDRRSALVVGCDPAHGVLALQARDTVFEAVGSPYTAIAGYGFIPDFPLAVEAGDRPDLDAQALERIGDFLIRDHVAVRFAMMGLEHDAAFDLVGARAAIAPVAAACGTTLQ